MDIGHLLADHGDIAWVIAFTVVGLAGLTVLAYAISKIGSNNVRINDSSKRQEVNQRNGAVDVADHPRPRHDAHVSSRNHIRTGKAVGNGTGQNRRRVIGREVKKMNTEQTEATQEFCQITETKSKALDRMIQAAAKSGNPPLIDEVKQIVESIRDAANDVLDDLCD